MHRFLLRLGKLNVLQLAGGYHVIDNFLTPQQCRDFLELIAGYRANHNVPEVYRQNSQKQDRALHYWVIDGMQIEKYFPEIWQLYHNVNDIVNKVSGKNLTILKNKKVGVNINIMQGGCEYRWHYDRNAVTTILYLNEVPGGSTEVYPNYRLHLGRYKFTRIQQYLDLLLQTNIWRHFFSQKQAIEPRQGRILIMQADRCLHSVSPVEGDQHRINIIMAYDYPETQFPMEKNLDSYLYTQEKSDSIDPNYS